jgi:hypothetical protein
MVKRLVVLLLLASCTSGNTGKVASTGSVNELLVVTNDKTQWEGALGDTLRTFFMQDQIGLSQPEAVFDLVNIGNKDFKELFTRFHNIFIVDINPQATKITSESFSDLWATPQRVIKITAPDLPSFYKEFDLKKESYLKLFIDLERIKTLTVNKMRVDDQLSNKVAQKFGIRIPIPEGFYTAKEAPDFIWLRHNVTKVKQELELGILIYTMHYHDAVVFNPRHIIQWRNSITKEYIPGQSPDSYMQVADEVIQPVFDTITDFPGGYAVETRGLWDVANDFMGGPFINFTFVDKSTNEAITLDGYIYNPNDVKKYYMRELESIFYATKFTSQK